MDKISLNRTRFAKRLFMELCSPQRRADLPSFLSARTEARASPLGVLWTMIIPIVIACLVGCTGFVSPNKSPTLAAVPNSRSSKPQRAPALQITTSALAGGTVQSSYIATLTATGGVPPYTWSTTGGQLPTGLSVNPSTGTIAGTPVSDGTFSFTTKVQDSSANSVSASFSLNISPGAVVGSNSSSWSPSVLRVTWATDFASIAANQINVKTDSRLSVKAAGDGATDDTPAIRAAIQLAASIGGGAVYFPASDYKIIVSSDSLKGSPLAVPSRVILRGDNSTASRIFVNNLGAAGETDGTWTWGGIDFQGSSLSGVTDLAIFAVNSSTSPWAVLWNRGSSHVSELFFNNVDIHLDSCKAFWFEGTNNLLVQNSNFDSSNSTNTGNPSQYGPIYVVGNSNVSFLNNRITYHFGRVHMQNNTNLLMQGNTLIRDAENEDMDNGTAVESGGVELSFDQNVQVLNNTIETLNAPSNEAGDGEAIMSQQSSVQNVLDAGSTTAITLTTLTDANALWGTVTASRLAQFPEVVAIVSGSGTGEWRVIQSVNTSTKTLTLSQPWTTVPEVGSLYSIFGWTLLNATIQGNTLIDNPNGIVLYDGCANCTVLNNSLTNSRGIILRTVDEALNPSLYPEGRRMHEVAINTNILNNTVLNSSGIRPAYIALDTEAFDTSSYSGMGMIGIQVGGNAVTPYSENPSLTYPNPKQNEITQEGLFPCFLFGPAQVKVPLTTIFQNINFWNNAQAAPVTYSSNFLPLTSQACVTASAPVAQ
jgi:parallel beta-helix repeat protein